MKTGKKLTGFAVYSVTAFSAFIIILAVALMMAVIIWGGYPTLTWEFLSSAPSEGMTKGGIFPAIVGTFFLVVIMSFIGVPIGTMTAIYLCEYAKPNSIFSRIIRFAVNTLAGVPAIVFGLFGLGFFVHFVGAGVDSVVTGGTRLVWGKPNLLWASLTMAFMTLPVVIVSVEEAIKAVPKEYKEASLALGATKWETISKVILPNSIEGVLTGAILAVSRGAGEVAPILFVGAAYFIPYLPNSLSDQFMELGYHIYIMSTQSTNVEATAGIQYATTLVLLLMTFGLNFAAIFLRYKARQRLIR
jgi:phosphate transport system permease protein